MLLWPVQSTSVHYVARAICLLQGAVQEPSDRRSWKGTPKGRGTNELRGRVTWHHASRLLLLLLNFLSFNNDKTTSYLFAYMELLEYIRLKQKLVSLKFVCLKAILAYAIRIRHLNGVISRLRAICQEHRHGSDTGYLLTLPESDFAPVFVVYFHFFSEDYYYLSLLLCNRKAHYRVHKSLLLLCKLRFFSVEFGCGFSTYQPV
jgi:hypothetical protein